MRPMLQLFLGVFLTLGLSTSAHAVGFNLTFANPGADCANQASLPTDCSNGIDVVNPGFLSWDIAGGSDELFVQALANVNGLNPQTDWTRGTAIQDFPDLGGVAVLSATDQVEDLEGLFFHTRARADFAPIVTFTDDHAAIDPTTSIFVAGYDDLTPMVFFNTTVGDVTGGALLPYAGINGWLFVNRNEGGPTWYVSSMSTIPEPGTAALLGFGLTGLAARRRKTLA